jgi:hypothetical protein
VLNNLVELVPYAGIMVGWQTGAVRPPPGYSYQFVLQGNRVRDCGLATLSDFGGIYVSTANPGEACEATHSCFLPTLIEENYVTGMRGYNYG